MTLFPLRRRHHHHRSFLKVLEDDLAREQFKEATRLKVKNHLSLYRAIEGWKNESMAYLRAKETVQSSEQAKQQLAFLEAFEAAKVDKKSADVAGLESLGAQIRAAKCVMLLAVTFLDCGFLCYVFARQPPTQQQ